MSVSLQKIKRENELIQVQAIYQQSFSSLLKKYQDFETNPANETLTDIAETFQRINTSFFFIVFKGEMVGVVRVLREKQRGRIAPIAILPKFQGQGIGYLTFAMIEEEFKEVTLWVLEIMKQEEKLLHFYQKLGYKRTGQEEKISSAMTLCVMEKSID